VNTKNWKKGELENENVRAFLIWFGLGELDVWLGLWLVVWLDGLVG
jgi:hypothetical protein